MSKSHKLVVILIVFMFLVPFIPQARIKADTDAVSTQSLLSEGVVGEFMLGESVDYEMSIPDKVPAEITSIISTDGNIFDFGRSGAGANDGEVWYIESDTDGITSVQLNGYFETHYVNLDTFYWEIDSEGTQSVLTRWDDIALYPNGAWTLYAWVDNVAGSQAIDSTYVYNDRMEFTLYAASSAIGGSDYIIEIDQFYISTANVTGSVRSEYMITDPTSTLHKVEIECFDYGVDIQVDVPESWVFQSVNPDASVADSVGRVIISETVPMMYEIFFTSDSSLRISSCEELLQWGFEDGMGVNVTKGGGSSGTDYEQNLDYITVSDGASSIHFETTGAYAGGATDTWEKDYWIESPRMITHVTFDVYWGGTAPVDTMSAVSVNVTDGNSLYEHAWIIQTAAASAWTNSSDRTIILNAPSDGWIHYYFQWEESTGSHDNEANDITINVLAYDADGTDALDVYVDNIRLYTKVLTEINDPEGTMYYITPYGLYQYSYSNFYATMTNSSGYQLENTTVTSHVDGSWEAVFSGTSFDNAGTYSVMTWAEQDIEFLDTTFSETVGFSGSAFTETTGYSYDTWVEDSIYWNHMSNASWDDALSFGVNTATDGAENKFLDIEDLNTYFNIREYDFDFDTDDYPFLMIEVTAFVDTGAGGFGGVIFVNNVTSYYTAITFSGVGTYYANIQRLLFGSDSTELTFSATGSNNGDYYNVTAAMAYHIDDWTAGSSATLTLDTVMFVDGDGNLNYTGSATDFGGVDEGTISVVVNTYPFLEFTAYYATGQSPYLRVWDGAFFIVDLDSVTTYDAWTTYHINVLELAGAGSTITQILIYDHTDNAQSFLLDDLRFYYFANYVYADSGDGTTHDVAYNSGGTLVWERNGATAGWVGLFDASPDENIWAEPWIAVTAWSDTSGQAYMRSYYDGTDSVTNTPTDTESIVRQSCGGYTTLTDINFTVFNSANATFGIPTWNEIDDWADTSWNSEDQTCYQGGAGLIMNTTTGTNIGLYNDVPSSPITLGLYISIRYRTSATAQLTIGMRDEDLDYESEVLPTSTSWTNATIRLSDYADYTFQNSLERLFLYLSDPSANGGVEIDYIRIINRDVDEFTVIVQQLGMTGATLTELSTDTYVLDVTGETYSNQLYMVYLAEDSVLSNTNHAVSNETGWGDMFDNDHTGWGTFRCSVTDNPDSVTIETTSAIGSAFIVYNFADDLDVTDVQWLEVYITNLDLGFQLRIRDTDGVEYYPGAFENDNGTYNYNLYDALGATKTIDQITFYTASVIGDHFDMEYVKIYNPYYPDVLVGYGSDGCLIDAVNITGGQHNFVVGAITRQQGNEANGIYYAYITGTITGNYAISYDLRLDIWSVAIIDYIYVSCITNWANTTVYMFDNDTAIGNSLEGTNIVFPKDLIDGLHLLGFYVDGGAAGLWVNASYTVAVDAFFYSTFVETRINDDTIRISIITSWANATISCYDNDTLISSANEGMNLDFLKDNSMGLHRISFLADGTADEFWVNTSYTITFIEVFISVYSDIDGFGFADWSNVFKVYVNDTRIYETSYYASTNGINITVLSYFNETLYSADHNLLIDEDRSIEIPIALYEMILGNGGVNALEYTITRNGFTRTIIVSAGRLVPIRLPNATYTVVVTGLWTNNEGAIVHEVEKFRDAIILPAVGGILSFIDKAFADTARITQVGINQDYLTGVVLMSMFLSTISTVLILFVKSGRKPKTEFIPVPFEEQNLRTRTRPLNPRKSRKNLRM